MIINHIEKFSTVQIYSDTNEKLATRLISLDAFRGFIMIMMCISHGFGFDKLAEQAGFSSWVGALFTHASWEGLHFLDLIQPAFMFVVGISMALTFHFRKTQGATFNLNIEKVFKRSIALILLSQIIISISSNTFQFQLINVLSQISITYFICFLIMQTKFHWQFLIAILILMIHWLLFIAFPGHEGAFSQTDNIGAILDQKILGKNYPGSYVTLNFMSSTVTTLVGVWMGMLLINKSTPTFKMRVMLLTGILCLLIGIVLHPYNPMIKRLWTESFTLFSLGWVVMMLLVFYWLAEIKKLSTFVFPFTVVGMNSIFIYCLAMDLYPWLDKTLAIFTHRFEIIGNIGVIIQAITVTLIMWYFCFWLYQRRIFFKI